MPFTAELAIVKPLAPDANAIALLEPFAASGVPGNAALGPELATIVPADAASGAAERRRPTAGFLDRLQANAGKTRPRPPGRRGGASATIRPQRDARLERARAMSTSAAR